MYRWRLRPGWGIYKEWTSKFLEIHQNLGERCGRDRLLQSRLLIGKTVRCKHISHKEDVINSWMRPLEKFIKLTETPPFLLFQKLLVQAWGLAAMWGLHRRLRNLSQNPWHSCATELSDCLALYFDWQMYNHIYLNHTGLSLEAKCNSSPI